MQPYLEERNELERCERRRPACRTRPCRESRWSEQTALHTLENAAADLKEKVRDNLGKYLWEISGTFYER